MPKPLDLHIYERAKEIVYSQYNKPSAYRSGALIKKYKEMGGTFAGKKSSGKLKRWFDEKWTDIGNEAYPVYRPTIRIDVDTPLTASEIDAQHAQEQIKLKQKIKGSKNLPPFMPRQKKDGTGLKRAPGVYPPRMRKLLSEVGNEGIHSLLVVRTPLSKFVTTLLNTISLGAYDKAVRESSYEKMFHLSMLLNGDYILEKNGVVSFTRGDPIRKGSERSDVTNVPLAGKEITIQQAIDATREKLGNERFSNYRATSWNCQDFLLGFLDANGLSSDSLRQFIYQNPKEIFSRMPQFAQKIGQTLTDTDAVVNRIVEGEGARQTYMMYQNGSCWTIVNKHTDRVVDYCLGSKEQAQAKLDLLNKVDVGDEIRKDNEILKKSVVSKDKMKTWREFFAEACKGKKFTSRQAVNDFMKECSVKYKAMKAKQGK